MKGFIALALIGCVFSEYKPDPHLVPEGEEYSRSIVFLISQFYDGMPHSYKDTLPNGTSYWSTKAYLSVGAIDYTGKRVEMDSQIATQERVLVRDGLNLYDAATWQIALALWRQWNLAKSYERNILYPASTGTAFGMPDPNSGDGQVAHLPGLRSGLINIRADNPTMFYGDQRIPGDQLKKIPYPGNVTHYVQDKNGDPKSPGLTEGPGAFFFRMIAPYYYMRDPFFGYRTNSWIYPWPNTDNTTTWDAMGYIHFNDWKPITGENVWAAIIGPLQRLYLETGGNLTNTTCGKPEAEFACDFRTWNSTPPAVQLGISILPAMEAMLSKLGALFHCPWGSKLFPPDPDEGTNVSNENNFSAYAALTMLKTVLTNYTTGSADEYLQYGLKTVTTLVTAMDKWFDNWLLSDPTELPDGSRLVYQGGHVKEATYYPGKLTQVGGLAVDCQTWGMTVMGAPRMDKAYGDNAAYKVWQATKKYAGFYRNGKIAGVGYTSEINNSTVNPNNAIWSAEWTFGAINMAQVLAGQYKEMGKSDVYDDLMSDANSMLTEVTKIWPDGLQFADGSFVYANQRFFIPWGWYSNPIGALCSTAWFVMQEQNFNPFQLGGGDKPSIESWKEWRAAQGRPVA